MHPRARLILLLLSVAVPSSLRAAEPSAARPLEDQIRQRAAAIEPKLIAWRRDIHEHPELGNQEVRTSKLVAEHLQSLGLEVKTGVAKTGVVGLLRGGKPGPVVALRADMDALPVKEATTDLPFASKAKGSYIGAPGGSADLMHACGHDAHTAILMATAEVLAGLKDQLPGTVKFLFQPAEEGPSDFLPDGKKMWGAKLMVQEGAMTNPKPDAVFGLHATSSLPAGTIGYRPGPAMAGAADLHIKVTGRGTHAARPWTGVDPITVAAQIQLGLQTIISRQTDISKAPSVITIGMIHGGTRLNIISDVVQMDGTIRTFDSAIMKDLQARVKNTAEHLAQSAGATVEVSIVDTYDVLANDPALTERTVPALGRAADGHITAMDLISSSEDFSAFAQVVPGFFFRLGTTPKDKDPKTAPTNHSALFYIDESSLVVGVRALAVATADFLHTGGK